MDVQPINQQPISDDQELAKVLAGVNQQANEAAATQPEDDTPAPADTPASDQAVTTDNQSTDSLATETALESPASPSDMQPNTTPPISNMSAVNTPLASATSGDSELDSIKKDALSELRPLVDKLNVSPEEKFDTYLLLLRSTDDKALIAPAHDAAKGIADEARRAQALLDIIKEIDYLAGPQQQATS